MSKSIGKHYSKLQRLIHGEGGQDLVEYGLAVTLIALVCITGIQGAASSLNQAYGQIAQALDPTQQAPAQSPTPAPTPTPGHHHHHDGGGGGGGWWWHH